MTTRSAFSRTGRNAVAVVVAGSLASTLALGGCSAADSYRLNPTPELATMSNTHDEAANRTTVTLDTNLGAFWEDAARFMLVDRPTRLVRSRVPY